MKDKKTCETCEACEACEASDRDLIATPHGVLCKECMKEQGWGFCSQCDEVYSLDDLEHYDGDAYCIDCANNANLGRCDYCGELFSNDDLNDCGGSWYCTGCVRHNGYECCDRCGVWSQNCIHAYNTPYCETCFPDLYFICDGCGEVYDLDDLTCNDGRYCRGCMSDRAHFDARHFYGGPEYDLVGSPRKWGIELETYECEDNYLLDGGYWEAKEDGSISGLEFASAILWGNDGFAEIDKLCNFAKQHYWRVDGECGYHAHFNLGDENIDSLKAIAFAYSITYDVWKTCVDSDRVGESWCKEHQYTLADYLHCTDLSDWFRFADKYTRYAWVNWAAYNKYRTVEIRLHQGTLNADQIKNWISAHAIFIDWASNVGFNGVQHTLWEKTTTVKRHIFNDIFTKSGKPDLAEYFGMVELCKL